MRAWLLVGVVVAGCSNPNVGRARVARYDAEPSLVYSGALDVVRDKFRVVEASPATLEIKTAWQQVHSGSSSQEQASANCPVIANGCPRSRRVASRVFVRFDVRVTGERPYRVAVDGHAASWTPGAALPTELTGIERPGWLDERRDALAASIYKRLRGYAVAPATTATR